MKILPAEVAGDAERAARFKREAQVLASLNHPNIAAIHGIEEHDGLLFLVLEHVPGEDLSERLKRGAMSLREALDIVNQIADALDEAHAKGIVHRDLKPANIMITPEGLVKVLDFGLARLIETPDAGASEAGASDSPTLARDLTGAGMIVGTACYMSPEQARGKHVDKRTDIWAFGCVLYEMLAGHKAFDGESVSDALAAVLKSEPDYNRLPEIPPRLRETLERSLQKDVKKRARDMGDLRFELDHVTATRKLPKSGSVPVLAMAASALALGALIGSLSAWNLRPADPKRVQRYTIPTEPLRAGLGAQLAISPDGGQIVYAAAEEGVRRLYLRPVGGFDARRLAGTENAIHPVFSPDGSELAFYADAEEEVKKIRLPDGPPVTLTAHGFVRGLTWENQSSLILGSSSGLLRVSASGGEPTVLVSADEARGEAGYFWPEMLPSGRDVLFTTLIRGGGLSEMRIATYSLSIGEKRVVLDEEGHNARLTASGHLLFFRGNAVMASRLDRRSLTLAEPPKVVFDGVSLNPGGIVHLALAQNGTLVFVPGTGFNSSTRRRLVWVDRNGAVSPLADDQLALAVPRVSADGRRIVVEIGDRPGTNNPKVAILTSRLGSANVDLWIYDVDRGTRTRQTFDAASRWPIWSHDGNSVLFSAQPSISEPHFRVMRMLVDRNEKAETLAEGPMVWASSFSSDGKWLAMSTGSPQTNDVDIELVDLSTGDTEPFIATDAAEWGAEFSPAGGIVAYVSDETGRPEIYLTTYPASERKWQISRGGGLAPRWSIDGAELFYANGPSLMSVSMESGPELRIGDPVEVFRNPTLSLELGWDLDPDGDRMIAIQPEEVSRKEIRVVLNWFEELNELVPPN